MEVVIFAKAPVPGRVKTRLARFLGAGPACRIYRQMAERVVARLTASGYSVRLSCAPGPAHPFFRMLRRRYGVALEAQPPGDLGRRMAQVLAASHGRPRALVGADCLGVSATHVAQAEAALEHGADAAIAPAPDGGYTLIAAAWPDPALFRAVPWGTPRVQAVTRQRARAAGLRVQWIAPAWDVDTPDDLRGNGLRPVLPPRRVVSCRQPARR